MERDDDLDLILRFNESYLDEWGLLLGKLLGWSEEKINAWLETEGRLLQTFSMLRHETPLYYVEHLLLPSGGLSDKIGRDEYRRISSEISIALDQANKAFSDIRYDWSEAKRRVREVLDKAGLHYDHIR